MRAILEAVNDFVVSSTSSWPAGFPDIRTVCIGGMNASNVEATVLRTGSSKRNLNGIAVVSDIMASPDPEAAARDLLGRISQLPPFWRRRGAGTAGDQSQPQTQADSTAEPGHRGRRQGKTTDVREMVALAPTAVRVVRTTRPLTHNMTNTVVQNFAANVALAVGASPIMSVNGDEAADLARLGGGLVINMGTVTDAVLAAQLTAIAAYNAAGQPVVFDPVGAGASAVRRAAAAAILAGGELAVIKGNGGEIAALLAGTGGADGTEQAQQRGVDGDIGGALAARADLARRLARREGCVVVLSGEVDVVTDGERCVSVSNGDAMLGAVTGTGCALGTVISAACAVYPTDILVATLAALLLYEVAAERAVLRSDCRGPGTFVPAFLDELAAVSQATVDGDTAWINAAHVASL